MWVILQHCTVTIVMLIGQSIIIIILILEKAYYGYMKEEHFKKACFRFQPLFALRRVIYERRNLLKVQPEVRSKVSLQFRSQTNEY